jgi:hypothetical protein
MYYSTWPCWTPKEIAMYTDIIEGAMAMALFCSQDDGGYLDARIAANYAFMIHPEWREPPSWDHPAAMQFRGYKYGHWVPSVGSVGGVKP